jgi:hypothetical protein
MSRPAWYGCDNLVGSSGRKASTLAAHEHAGSAFGLSGDAVDLAHQPSVKPASSATQEVKGSIIAGRNKLLEQIGERDVGEVRVFDQLGPIKRRVTIKLFEPITL